MFKVISIRSNEIRTVYAVDHCARFLIYKDGEWSWNDCGARMDGGSHD